MFTNKSTSVAKEKEFTTASATIIAPGTEITGHIESKGDIRVDGTLHGNLSTSAKVFVGAEGVIKGDVSADQADVQGRIEGNVKVRELLYLRGQCHVQGNIHTAQLQVDATASFNGECHMGPVANVVELKKEASNDAWQAAEN